jgi:ABC-type transporter lipoprotein component MlaA
VCRDRGTPGPRCRDALHKRVQDQRFAEVADPWEGFNRRMYRFNFYFDKYLYLP